MKRGGAPDDGALSDHGYLTPVSVGGRTLLFGMTVYGGAPGPNPNDSSVNGTVFAVPLPAGN